MMWIILCGGLLFLCLILICHVFFIKRELKSMKRELARTEEPDYNRQLTITLFDKDLSALAVQINHNLDYQKQLKGKAQQSERLLRQSVSDIAHDLRTPLTVIRGNLQMMEREGGITGKNRERMAACQNKTKVLREMVDDFFEMSILESGERAAVLDRVDITKLLMQFIVDHEAVIRSHGLIPDIRLPERSAAILADEQLLLRMLENLLGNVMKYARKGFVLEVKLQEDGRCRICFSNELDREQAARIDTEHIFERTYRASRSRTGSGAGLGLYIVKLLAEKQGALAEAAKKEERLEISILFPQAMSPGAGKQTSVEDIFLYG